MTILIYCRVLFALIRLPEDPISVILTTVPIFFAVVLYFNQKQTDTERKQIKLWTRHMIDVVLRLGDTYYLTYQRYATRQQLVRAYPRIDDFFQSKQRWDPHSLFENDWYNVYRNMTE